MGYAVGLASFPQPFSFFWLGLDNNDEGVIDLFFVFRRIIKLIPSNDVFCCLNIGTCDQNDGEIIPTISCSDPLYRQHIGSGRTFKTQLLLRHGESVIVGGNR